MTKTKQEKIKDKYSKLVLYISQLGYKTDIIIDNQIELIIDVYGAIGNSLLKVKLFQPLDREREYNFHRLRISWAISPNEYLGNCKWYQEDTNQDVIFNTLLFDIINYKLDNINATTVDSSNILVYTILKDWFNDKNSLHNKEASESRLSLLYKIRNLFKI